MNHYVISTPQGLIAGISQAHQCVQWAATQDWAKLFKSEKTAAAFIQKYKSGGYGLIESETKIIKV